MHSASSTQHRSGRTRWLVVGWFVLAASSCLDRSAEAPRDDEGAASGKRYAVRGPKDTPRYAPAEAAAGTRAKGEQTPSGGARDTRSIRGKGAEGGGGLGISGVSGVGLGGGGLGQGFGSGQGVGHARSARSTASWSTQSLAPTANPRTESYAHTEDVSFLDVKTHPVSTFSVDVDTASYSNVRRFLREGTLPPVDAVRVEEMINYFSYSYPEPRGAEPFSVTTEMGECPWAPAHRLVHVGLRGKSVPAAATPPRNLVFLIDVSGSMSSPDKLPLLRHGMKMLTRSLRAQDRVSIVVYAGASGLVLPATSGSEHEKIVSALDELHAGGSTNGGAGIELAYRQAARSFVRGGINRVILATDGDFNVGVSSDGALTRLIGEKRKSGVFLTVLGFGRGNLQDSRMEALADRGNGNYAYIDSASEARKVLVNEAGATLVTIAKDVKVQVELNPAHVASYRLIGYTNRLLAREDFNDDSKDAGDIGAGHTVTALYEVVPAGSRALGGSVDPLRYQNERTPSSHARSPEWMTLALRYKQPDRDDSRKLTVSVTPNGSSPASRDFRFSAAVAEFAMLLRGSAHVGAASYESARALAEGAAGSDASGRRSELVELIERARSLADGRSPRGGVMPNGQAERSSRGRRVP